MDANNAQNPTVLVNIYTSDNGIVIQKMLSV